MKTDMKCKDCGNQFGICSCECKSCGNCLEECVCEDHSNCINKIKIEDPELLEELANLEHQQWNVWAKIRIPEHPLIDIPYSYLTEEQKEQDRVFARKVIGILRWKLLHTSNEVLEKK